MSGVGVIKIFFYPNAKIEEALAEVTGINQTVLRNLPPGIQPPLIVRYSASSVPVLQLAIGGKRLSEEQLSDYGQNFFRVQLATIQSIRFRQSSDRRCDQGNDDCGLSQCTGDPFVPR
jgi:multidrug efflux pump subunit AcrB